MNSFANLERLGARGHWGIKRGLDNIRALLSALDHPEKNFPCLLIAGTNGKGSTGAFLVHALSACGVKTGWTTSPHLISPAERIWIDGACVSEIQLNELLGQVFSAEASLGIQATYFELMIAAAIQAFREARVDLAVVEVGLGGRWDSTNALDPILTVLTSVGLDHTQFLGNTRESVAREKLCTARQGRPLVLAQDLDPRWIWPLLETRPELFSVPRLHTDEIAWDHSEVEGHAIGLAGAHQIGNLATAMEALRVLRRLGWNLDEDNCWRGFSETRWPGRLWAVPGLQNVWMDGAHNPQGAEALATHARACGVRPHLYFGAMKDKDLHSVAQLLLGMDPLSVTLIYGEDERYANPDLLRKTWGSLPCLTVPQAIQELSQDSPDLRLVTGSLFLLGDLIKAMGITLHP